MFAAYLKDSLGQNYPHIKRHKVLSKDMKPCNLKFSRFYEPMCVSPNKLWNIAIVSLGWIKRLFESRSQQFQV